MRIIFGFILFLLVQQGNSQRKTIDRIELRDSLVQFTYYENHNNKTILYNIYNCDSIFSFNSEEYSRYYFDISKDNKFLAIPTYDSVMVYDLKEKKLINKFKAPYVDFYVSFSNSNDYLYLTHGYETSVVKNYFNKEPTVFYSFNWGYGGVREFNKKGNLVALDGFMEMYLVDIVKEKQIKAIKFDNEKYFRC
jgi:hypothetical protein